MKRNVRFMLDEFVNVKNTVKSTDSESVSKSELNGNNETTYVYFNLEKIEKS